MNPYDDIIHLPQHVSQNHPRMPMRGRAAQFAPFAAITGFEDALAETGRITDQRRELDALELAELNRRLAFLISRLGEQPEIDITYFVPDAQKSGGSYQTISGPLKKISEPERILSLCNGRTIRLDDIAAINGAVFDTRGSD